MTQFKRHERPLNWLDQELKQNFGIDVYSREFPKDKGFSIYRKGNTEAMVIKLEKLGEAAAEAFEEFLGISSFELVSANIGQEKKTADLYGRFLNSIKLPPEYLDTMYNSRFVGHFYNPEELQIFRRRWSASPE